MEFWPEFMANVSGREFFAGAAGGIAGVISGHPLDTLRVRLQQPPPSSSPSPILGRAGAVGGAGAPPVTTSAARLLRSIVSSEGPAALYRGMTAPLATITFQNALVFQIYAVLRQRIAGAEDGSPAPYAAVAAAGVGTGALQSLLLCPVELVKIRLQLQMAGPLRSCREGAMSMAKRILAAEGVSGIYRGLLVTVLRDAPAHGVYFWSYEVARERLHRGCRRDGGEGVGTMLFAGGMAGMASWVCCYPLDVVKSRIQAQPAPEMVAGAGGGGYRGIADCLRRSVKEEGHAVLWRGLGTALARAFVVNGAIFSAYELALRALPAAAGDSRITLQQN